MSEQNPVFIPGRPIYWMYFISLRYCLNGSPFFKVAGKDFRIGHLGSQMDVMALFGIATAEMALVDLSFPVSLVSGVSAAQEYYRKSAKKGE